MVNRCATYSDKRLWNLTNHVCGECMGRVLEHTAGDGTVIARCADCGNEKEGGHRAICTCGMLLSNGLRSGLYCAPNEGHVPGKSQEIVGLFDELACGQPL